MKKILVSILLCASIVGLAQVDSATAFHTGEAASNFLLDLIGVPTPVKLSVHTIAAFVFGALWMKFKKKKTDA